ncbi:F-box/kelch-repeat protein At4g19930-like [Primulina eburnea]|uniref:F-box/kelch-repeat protein At4g19930-like n=1 Tax=Primulina eburnea TaxID=1245227 RepID=UPI003C6C9F82
MASDQLLPYDAVFEILTQLNSLKALDICKAVSKEWKEVIQESSFASTHCRRTGTISGYFVQDLRFNKHVTMFVTPDNVGVCMKSLPKDTKILASSSKQGILCCEREIEKGSKRLSRYLAYIPITGQLRDLPNPKTRHETVSVTLMVAGAQPLCFKIIRLSKRGFIRRYSEQYKYGCEIFDSGTWTWKEASDELSLPFREIIARNSSVSVADSVHWLTTEDNILSYNITNNSFSKFPLPKPVQENLHSYKSKQLFEYEGKLGLVCLTEGRDMDLWIMNDIKNQTWKKERLANIETLESFVQYPFLLGFYNSHVVFVEGGFNEVGFYKLQDSSFSSVKLGRLDRASEIFRFRSDVEPDYLSL